MQAARETQREPTRHTGLVPDPSAPRSVKIDKDERGGWSSDRPRGGDDRPPRPVDISTRCRVLPPTDAMRYSPGSLLLVASGSAPLRTAFTERLITDRSSLLSLAKIRGLLEGRLPAEEIEAKAAELLAATAAKRLAAGDTVVIALETLSREEREPLVRLAHGNRRPRHLIFLEAPRDKVADEDADAVNELRQAVNTASLGEEGIQTAMRLSGATIGQLKRIAFRPAPKDD